MDSSAELENTPEIILSLAKSHQEFLAFVTRRVGGDRELAKEIVQEAFRRGLEKLEQLRSDDSARAWFYRSLRNAVIDHQRRKHTSEKALTTFADELLNNHTTPEEENTVCQCIARLATTLKPEYKSAIDQVEVAGMSMTSFAEREGITPNNAAVRVFRAREALRKRVMDACGTCAEHGCFNCTCQPLASF
jgi:RNA polymerase sigma factor (sigma-70 family)